MAQVFFEKQSARSAAKSAIVVEYFGAWANVMKHEVRRWGLGSLGYVDLFSGPGRYEDGSPSTPLLILDRAIADPVLNRMLVTIFNDKSARFRRALSANVEALPGIEKLAHSPKLSQLPVGEWTAEDLSSVRRIPTLFFLDPWGYKGLSLKLIAATLAPRGCECIFFFNYRRVNAALDNPALVPTLAALFGRQRIRELRNKIAGQSPTQREAIVMEVLQAALCSEDCVPGAYVLPFRVRSDSGGRTTHYLVYVTKHHKGHQIMKDVMGKHSSRSEQGIPTFGFCAAELTQLPLFDASSPMDRLKQGLLTTFAGRDLTVMDIYVAHGTRSEYRLGDYKRALIELEQQGEIVGEPALLERPRVRNGASSCGDGVRFHFPERTA